MMFLLRIYGQVEVASGLRSILLYQPLERDINCALQCSKLAAVALLKFEPGIIKKPLHACWCEDEESKGASALLMISFLVSAQHYPLLLSIVGIHLVELD